ncbi:MAG TPA: porin [Novosphingobium sp.]
MTSYGVALAGAVALGLAGGMPQAQAAPLSEAEGQALRDEVERLRAKLEAIEKRLADGGTPPPPAPQPPAPQQAAAAPASAPATRIEWKGSPRFVSEDRAFKVKGRIQADANYVAAPEGLNDRGLGFSNEFRRIRLGGEGQLGSGFGYKLELELSDNGVDLVDTFVTYQKGPWLVTLGNHNAFQGIDELTGDTSGSFMERAAFTDAFNFERRLGLSLQHERGALLAQLGVFTDDITALANASDGPAGGDENNAFSIDGRLVYAPKIDDTQLHLAGSAHWRKLGRIAAAPTRYRQRPYIHSSNSRLIGTPGLPVERELNYGLELAAIDGPWHAAGEVHWLRADRIGLPSARFWGGYAEVGYFLTKGDTRAYDNGYFGAMKPARAMGKGGVGAVQVNLRYDYLDLDSGAVRGGKQNGYMAALIWAPIANLRFNLNYAYLDYDGAVPLADGRTSYGLHTFGSRFELDF